MDPNATYRGFIANVLTADHAEAREFAEYLEIKAVRP